MRRIRIASQVLATTIGIIALSGPVQAGNECRDRPLLGDANCDRLINNFDIDPFVLALSDPAEYAIQFPECDIRFMDINGDGFVNNFDIDPFVALISGRPAPHSDPGGPYLAECQGAFTTLQLSGECSTDPMGGAPLAEYAWSTDCPDAVIDDPNSPTPLITIPNAGCEFNCTVSLRVVREGTGEETTVTTTITIRDTTPPQLSGVESVNIDCGGSTDPEFTGIPTATDTCGSTSDPQFTDVLDGETGEIRRTWTVSDDCENIGVLVQVLTFLDEFPPVVTGVEDVTVECGASTDPKATGTAVANDNCDGELPATFNDTVTDSGIERTWSATDEAGNTGTLVQRITILDTIAPELTTPDDVTVECGSDISPEVTGVATATDACDGALTPTFSDSPGKGAEIIRTWTARDAAGNETRSAQGIRFVDTTAPTIQCPANVRIETSETSLAASQVTLTATATDNCSTPTVVDDRPTNFATGVTIVTFTATDEAGNSSTCTATVEIVTVPSDNSNGNNNGNSNDNSSQNGNHNGTSNGNNNGSQNSNDNGSPNGNDNGASNGNDNSDGGRPQPDNSNDNQSGADQPKTYHEEQLIITTTTGLCGPFGLVSLSLSLLGLGALRMGRGFAR